MPQYLTPQRYRKMALGIDLTEKTDAELGALIASASSQANRWCAAPTNHDFRGGTVEREEHVWDIGNVMRAPSGRLWPQHCHGVMQVTECPQIDIYTTQTQYIRFTEATIFRNARLGYVEPVAAPITTALFTSIPPWLLSSPVAYIDYTYAFAGLSVTDELLYPLGGKVYQATNQFWTTDDVTIKVAGATVTTGFTLDLTEGWVIFDDLQDPVAEITASYSHKMPFDIAMGTAVMVTDLLGYVNINASGLGGLSGIRVEEIELRQSSKAGYNNKDIHPVAEVYLAGYKYASWA